MWIIMGHHNSTCTMPDYTSAPFSAINHLTRDQQESLQNRGSTSLSEDKLVAMIIRYRTPKMIIYRWRIE